MPNEKTVELYWITGASSGIGRALALALAQAGEDVAVTARSVDELQSIARDSRAMPGAIHPYPADVTDTAAVKDVVNRMEAEHGPVHHAILNAGTYDPQRSSHLSAEGYRHVFEVNVVGIAGCIEALLPSMRKRGAGEIALMGSLSAYRGLPEAAPYGASKAALFSMAESLAPGLARYGIRLRLISPGFIRTPMTEQNRFPMPMIMDVDKAVAIILRGLRGKRFEIAFPLRLAWMLRIARCLPNGLWFGFARRLLPGKKSKTR